MRCGLCNFLIIKPQTALHHAVWCGAVQDYLRCDAVMPFYGRFWCNFYDLCGLCGLMNTLRCDHSKILSAGILLFYKCMAGWLAVQMYYTIREFTFWREHCLKFNFLAVQIQPKSWFGITISCMNFLFLS